MNRVFNLRVLLVVAITGLVLVATMSVSLLHVTTFESYARSEAIRALDGRGLVRRQPNATDKRASDVTLTEDGQAIYSEIAPTALDYEARMLDGFSADDALKLQALLDQLEQSLDGISLK